MKCSHCSNGVITTWWNEEKTCHVCGGNGQLPTEDAVVEVSHGAHFEVRGGVRYTDTTGKSGWQMATVKTVAGKWLGTFDSEAEARAAYPHAK